MIRRGENNKPQKQTVTCLKGVGQNRPRRPFFVFNLSPNPFHLMPYKFHLIPDLTDSAFCYFKRVRIN